MWKVRPIFRFKEPLLVSVYVLANLFRNKTLAVAYRFAFRFTTCYNSVTPW